MSLRKALVAVVALCCAGAMQGEAAMVGAYAKADPQAHDVLAAAQFAAEVRHVRLMRIKSAETQIVAGRNFRLCLEVKDHAAVRSVSAVVYQDLSNTRRVTAWAFGPC